VPAGHQMEAMLAAFGSGAAEASRRCGAPVLNIDIGGSTVKWALVQDRNLLHTATMAVGGRLAVLDGDACLTRLDPAGEQLAALAGCKWSVGKIVREHDVERVTACMADAVVAVFTQNSAPPQIRGLWLTEPLPVPPRGTQGVMFSGGVSEYVYGREERDCGDLGRRFGRAIRQRLVAGRFPFPLLPSGEGIRATALGASEQRTRLSGRTVYLSRPDVLLPRRKLQVIEPPMVLDDTIDPAAVASAIRSHFVRFDLAEGDAEIALAFRWSGAPSHRRLAGFARGIVEALPRTVAAGKSVFVMLDADVAQTLGAILKNELGIASEVLVLDGLVLWDFDYVDLDCVRRQSSAVPVTIRSLIFKQDPRVPKGRRGHADRQPSA
jgi:ethanolamine utilization protein EutA